MTPIRLILITALTLSLASAAWAASELVPAPAATSSGGDGPIDISAEESLEWYKDKGLYVARGGARAIRGTMTVEADILTAKQKDAETKTASNTISFLTAEGHVKIFDPKQQVFGERAVYDLDRKTIKITGSNLKYITASSVVTAKDSLEYFEDKQIAVARGRALAEQGGNRIEGDVLTAHFAKDKTGQLDLTHMTAKGHVIVVTKDGGISRGDRGHYDAKKDIAYLMDHVRITRGETELAGDEAIVNFATGESRLLNSGSGRVRALLPSSNNKKSEDKKP